MFEFLVLPRVLNRASRHLLFRLRLSVGGGHHPSLKWHFCLVQGVPEDHGPAQAAPLVSSGQVAQAKIHLPCWAHQQWQNLQCARGPPIPVTLEQDEILYFTRGRISLSYVFCCKHNVQSPQKVGSELHTWGARAQSVLSLFLGARVPSQAMKRAKSGVYCGPLRLLAMEVYDVLNASGTFCDLITGVMLCSALLSMLLVRVWASHMFNPSHLRAVHSNNDGRRCHRSWTGQSLQSLKSKP